MIVTLAKMFTFDAAHFVPTFPDGHKCKRMHGHTYEVELVFRGRVPASGILIDYDEIAAEWAPIHAQIDHVTLNDVPGLEVPTTEVLAGWIMRQLFQRGPAIWNHLDRVTVRESSTTWCSLDRVGYADGMIGEP